MFLRCEQPLPQERCSHSTLQQHRQPGSSHALRSRGSACCEHRFELTSPCFSIRSTCDSSTASVTIFKPKSSRMARHLPAFLAKALERVRRGSRFPNTSTKKTRTTLLHCLRDRERLLRGSGSAQGPAMIASSLSPIAASSTRTTVLSGRRSSVTNLYGLVTRMTSATPARFSKRWPSIGTPLPVMPIADHVAPGMGCARKPTASTTFATASISDAVSLISWRRAFGLSESFPVFFSTDAETDLLPERDGSAPVEKRSLSIARFRAPTRGGCTASYLRLLLE